jgi:hypothetical protein
VAQAVECLPIKSEAQSSNPSTAKKKKYLTFTEVSLHKDVSRKVEHKILTTPLPLKMVQEYL